MPDNTKVNLNIFNKTNTVNIHFRVK